MGLGRFVVFGFASGGTDPRSAFPKIPINLLLMRAQQLLGSITYGELVGRGELSKQAVTPEQMQDPIPMLLDMVADRRLKPFISRTYDLQDFMKAFDDLARRKAIGKVVVSVNAGSSRLARL